MKLILEQDELAKAIENYVSTLGMDLSGKTVAIEFINGRGPNGNSATVEITEFVEEEEEEVVVEKKKTTRKSRTTKTKGTMKDEANSDDKEPAEEETESKNEKTDDFKIPAEEEKKADTTKEKSDDVKESTSIFN